MTKNDIFPMNINDKYTIMSCRSTNKQACSNHGILYNKNVELK